MGSLPKHSRPEEAVPHRRPENQIRAEAAEQLSKIFEAAKQRWDRWLPTGEATKRPE